MNKLSANNSIECLAHVPASASATVCTPDGGTTKQWRPVTAYGGFGVSACNVALTGNGLTLLEIVGATDATGSNTTVILSSGALTGTAVGNGAFLEVGTIQVTEVGKAAGLNLTHVAARLTVASSSDKAAVTYIRRDPRHPASGLTAATF
jgi:hypothetical protein